MRACDDGTHHTREDKAGKCFSLSGALRESYPAPSPVPLSGISNTKKAMKLRLCSVTRETQHGDSLTATM